VPTEKQILIPIIASKYNLPQSKRDSRLQKLGRPVALVPKEPRALPSAEQVPELPNHCEAEVGTLEETHSVTSQPLRLSSRKRMVRLLASVAVGSSISLARLHIVD
jgi:hypothetical protein